MKRVWVALVVAAVVVGWLLPLDAVATDLTDRFAAPSLAHPLGTDHLGRDVLARLVDGAWISVGLTAVALGVCAVLGTAAGLLSGYAGGVAADLVQRGVDILASIPTIVVGLVIAAVREPGTATLLLAVLITGWSPFARLAHHLTMRERAREYVEGAVAIGAGPVRIAVRHVLPNALRPLVAHACMRFANVLLSIAGLSFLGLGVQPPTPEWGVMLSEGGSSCSSRRSWCCCRPRPSWWRRRASPSSAAAWSAAGTAHKVLLQISGDRSAGGDDRGRRPQARHGPARPERGARRRLGADRRVRPGRPARRGGT